MVGHLPEAAGGGWWRLLRRLVNNSLTHPDQHPSSPTMRAKRRDTHPLSFHSSNPPLFRGQKLYFGAQLFAPSAWLVSRSGSDSGARVVAGTLLDALQRRRTAAALRQLQEVGRSSSVGRRETPRCVLGRPRAYVHRR
jgi:hypothetical protein